MSKNNYDYMDTWTTQQDEADMWYKEVVRLKKTRWFTLFNMAIFFTALGYVLGVEFG